MENHPGLAAEGVWPGQEEGLEQEEGPHQEKWKHLAGLHPKNQSEWEGVWLRAYQLAVICADQFIKKFKIDSNIYLSYTSRT